MPHKESHDPPGQDEEDIVLNPQPVDDPKNPLFVRMKIKGLTHSWRKDVQPPEVIAKRFRGLGKLRRFIKKDGKLCARVEKKP